MLCVQKSWILSFILPTLSFLLAMSNLKRIFKGKKSWYDSIDLKEMLSFKYVCQESVCKIVEKIHTHTHTHTHTGNIYVYIIMCVLVAQSFPTLCYPMDYSPPGFSVHRILQARILEWIAIPFSRGSSLPRDRILVSCIAGRFFIVWATGRSLSILLYTCTYKIYI